jgi:hypothetical protein
MLNTDQHITRMQYQGCEPKAAGDDKQDASEHPGITREIRDRVGIGFCQSSCNHLNDKEIPQSLKAIAMPRKAKRATAFAVALGIRLIS